MRYNPNGSIEAGSVETIERISVGKSNYTLSANLNGAKGKVKTGQIALLPDGSEWMRFDARKNSGDAWTVIQNQNK